MEDNLAHFMPTPRRSARGLPVFRAGALAPPPSPDESEFDGFTAALADGIPLDLLLERGNLEALSTIGATEVAPRLTTASR